MNWRLRVVHTTGYRYATAVTQSYNEARLTPRDDDRQNLMVSRVETVPPTRAYKYTDYWGTEVNSFDLHTPQETVLAVSKWVHDTLTYQRGTTGVHSSAVDAWQAGEGVCQDYAHLTLAMLRAVDVPARYVSGYLHTKPDAAVGETVVGESHAWVEAWTGDWLSR